MDIFMNFDFNITDIVFATYVKPGMGAPVHKDRASHGIAINISPDPSDMKKYVFADKKTILVGQNDIIYLPKGSSYTVSSKKSGYCYAINFDVSENVVFEPFVFKPKNPHAFIKEFERITELWKNKNTAFHMQCKANMYNIVAMIQCEYNSKYITRSTANLISPAVEYIKKNYTNENVCITELSAMCDISEDYFRKIFKNTFGTSPRKYINELKLSYSKELITSGMCTITEAAELSGYTDVSYFSREFKKAFGICPADYRKTIFQTQL
jgi:AraC-like DNA-binding protein